MNSFIETIKSRRSVRRFSDKPVQKKHIEQILDAARLAPSGGNLQGWHFIVLQHRNVIEKLESAIEKKIEELPLLIKDFLEHSEALGTSLAVRLRAYSLFFSSAPITIVILYKLNPYNKPHLDFLLQQGLDRHEAHQLMGYVEIQSTAAATENLILAAHSLGYSSCWMNIPFVAVEEVKAILDISHPWEISALVPIGYPDPKWSIPVIRKKKLDEIVTYL